MHEGNVECMEKGASHVKVWMLTALGMALVISCTVVLAAEPTTSHPTSIASEKGEAFGDFFKEVKERAETQNGKNWKETADASLIQDKETQWDRYLKAAMGLPDFVDLGIENRTRFESVSHPWRSTAKIGGDERIPSWPSGLGCALDWEMVLSGSSLKVRILVSTERRLEAL